MKTLPSLSPLPHNFFIQWDLIMWTPVCAFLCSWWSPWLSMDNLIFSFPFTPFLILISLSFSLFLLLGIGHLHCTLFPLYRSGIPAQHNLALACLYFITCMILMESVIHNSSQVWPSFETCPAWLPTVVEGQSGGGCFFFHSPPVLNLSCMLMSCIMEGESYHHI